MDLGFQYLNLDQILSKLNKIYPCVSGGTSDRDLDPLQNATHEYSPGATPNDYVNLKSPDPAYVNLQVSLSCAHCAQSTALSYRELCCAHCAYLI